MFIKEVLSQSRNDFTATLECEHCRRQQKLTSGYDDANYHQNVMPAITCKHCGMNRAGQTPTPQNNDGLLHVPATE